MVESTITKTRALVGGDTKEHHLYHALKESMKKAESIDILVSFLMESGVKMLLTDLKDAVKRGARIRILTGNYLGITQPSALYLIRNELGMHVDLRFYNESNRSFHPKAYIFHYGKDKEIYVGSSNISKSALTSGIEWNYRFSQAKDFASFDFFYDTFLDLYENHSICIDDEVLSSYSKNWHRPYVYKDLDRYTQQTKTEEAVVTYEPRGAQIEALYALKRTREEGANKALVQAATGIGKTYLSAFDSLNFQRVLFVAHREEILQQAFESFKNVRQSDDMGFFKGSLKDVNKSVIFASVATLGKDEYLNKEYFSPDFFDYIVVDEFHHAVSNQYQKIVKYFKPKFLLGLTATPERMDGKNIYEICDYNVPFEISLKEAINKGMLVPFHYYGIYDKTDYSSLKLVKGRYAEKDLNAKYLENTDRFDLIYKYYKKYPSKRALGFCCSRMHAEIMAKEFNKRGIPSVAVYCDAQGEFSEDRSIAIQQLKEEKIKVIFSVDMFNEGVDIDSLDMVMFLRPTESPIVFLQQLGRGLRLCEGKSYLNVLDFIGNYAKAGKTPKLLEGDYSTCQDSDFTPLKIEYPDDCIVDFDMQLIDLFKEMEKKSQTIKQQIQMEYKRIKEVLGKVPTRMELFLNMEDGIYEYCMNHAKENIFYRYMDFLHEMNDLSEDEWKVYSSVGKDFLNVIETTNMQKVYKMPILYSFYNDGDIKMNVTEEDVLYAWKSFFNEGTNWKDFKEGITYDEYKKMSDKKHLSNAKNNPIKFLQKSGNGFFVKKDTYALSLNDCLKDVLQNQAFVAHFKDIIEYRTIEYYRRRYRRK